MVVAAARGEARQIFVTPTSGDYRDIEAAQPGDEVIIASGTYRYRVHLDMQGTAVMPIVVRGEDPNNPPVFDYAGQAINTWPGSYPTNTPDSVRHAWLITGSYITVRDIEVTGARNAGGVLASAGFRFLNATCRGERLRSHHNMIGVEFGLTSFQLGGGSVVERSVLADNDVSVTHYGGKATIRNTVFRGARSHLYNGASSLTLESNWFEPPTDYFINIDNCAFRCGGTSNSQVVPRTMVFASNLFLRDATTASTWSLLLDGRRGPLSDDNSGDASVTEVYLLHNTFVNLDPAPPTNVDAVLKQGTVLTYSVRAYGNVMHHFEDAWVTSGLGTTIGAANWATEGTVGRFPNTRLDATPLFENGEALDFRPAPLSPLLVLSTVPSEYAPVSAPGTEPVADPLTMTPRARAVPTVAGAFDGVPDEAVVLAAKRLTVGCSCAASSPSSLVAWFLTVACWQWRRRRSRNIWARPVTSASTSRERPRGLLE